MVVLNINSTAKKPILVFGYGNLSRGDDAVGPLLLAHLEQHADLNKVEILNDFQLQIEHALDLQDREWVMFVDAAVNIEDAFAFTKLQPCLDNSYTSHAMSPQALMHVFENVTGQIPPVCFLLSIQACSFELGESLSQTTAANLQLACQFATDLLTHTTAEIMSMVTAAHS
jgi:hydrogenase maturation protease